MGLEEQGHWVITLNGSVGMFDCVLILRTRVGIRSARILHLFAPDSWIPRGQETWPTGDDEPGSRHSVPLYYIWAWRVLHGVSGAN